jgi:hypothetical protein
LEASGFNLDHGGDRKEQAANLPLETGIVRLFLPITAMLFILNGCAEQQLQPRQAIVAAGSEQRQMMVAAAGEQHQADAATCRARFSESDKDAVARAKCFNEADEKYASTTRYPDLAYLLIAKRSELAERQAAGKITRAQFRLELSELGTRLASEEQRRNNDADAVAPQQQANDNAAALMVLQSMQANRPAPYQLPMPAPPPPTLNTNCQTSGTNTYCQTR